MDDKLKLLESAAQKASTDSAFIAYYLEEYARIENTQRTELMNSLNCSLENYYRLGLCKAPEVTHPDYLARIKKISTYAQSSMMMLNTIIKCVSSIEKFRHTAGPNTYLMAARDKSNQSNRTDRPDQDEKQDH